MFGLAEIRSKETKLLTYKKYLLFQTTRDIGQKEVSFMVHRIFLNQLVLSFQSISEKNRVCKTELGRIVLIYYTEAPTSTSSEIECDNFYDLLIKTCNEIKLNKRNNLFIIDDFSSRVGDGTFEMNS